MPTARSGIWHARDERWEYATAAEIERAIAAAQKDHAARTAAQVAKGSGGERAPNEADDAPMPTPAAGPAQLSTLDRINRIIDRHPEASMPAGSVRNLTPGGKERVLAALQAEFGLEPPAPLKSSELRQQVRSTADSGELTITHRTLEFAAVHGKHFPLVPTGSDVAARPDDAIPCVNAVGRAPLRVAMCVIGEAPAAATAAARPADTAPKPKPALDAEEGPPRHGSRRFHERLLRRAQHRHVYNDGDQPAFN